MIRPKHIPIRTCVSCRETSEKRELLRVVRVPDGSVVHDSKGKMSGRGAYVCARPACIDAARKQKKLERSLKISAIPEDLFRTLKSLVSDIEVKGAAGATGVGNPAAVVKENPDTAGAETVTDTAIRTKSAQAKASALGENRGEFK